MSVSETGRERERERSACMFVFRKIDKSERKPQQIQNVDKTRKKE